MELVEMRLYGINNWSPHKKSKQTQTLKEESLMKGEAGNEVRNRQGRSTRVADSCSLIGETGQAYSLGPSGELHLSLYYQTSQS